MKVEMKMTSDQIDSSIKLMIAFTFCFTVLVMVVLSMWSLVFNVQPMNGIAPADKQFFFLLSDMSKYILGSLGTLLAIKGKEKYDDWRGQKETEPEPEPQPTPPAEEGAEEPKTETKGVTP
jgi:hypothetical protein